MIETVARNNVSLADTPLTVGPNDVNLPIGDQEVSKITKAVAVVMTPEEEKAIETNGLFQHLPSVYSEDEEDEDEDDSEEEEDDDESDYDHHPHTNSTTKKATTTNKQTSIPSSMTTKTGKSTTSTTGAGTTTSTTATTTAMSKKEIAIKKARLHYHDYDLDFTINQVLPRLFISDDMTARNKAMLVKYNITHILNLTTNIPNKFEPDITYLKIVIFDFETQNIAQYFNESFEFIENALKQNESNRVLVHCNAGISRSASFVIAYLLQKRLFKCYKDAYNHLKKARPVIEPNRGFEKQLINFEKRMRKNHRGCSIM